MSSLVTYPQVNIGGQTSLSHYANTDPPYPTADYWFNQTKKKQIALCKQKGHYWHLLVHTKVYSTVTGELITGPDLRHSLLGNISERSPACRERDISFRKPVCYYSYTKQRDAQILVSNLYFFINWLYMFRTIISSSSGATYNKLYRHECTSTAC